MNRKLLKPNKKYHYWSLECFPKVPKERGIGQPAYCNERGKCAMLQYESGEPIMYGDDLVVEDEYGNVLKWKVLYNAYERKNVLCCSSHKYRNDGYTYCDYGYMNNKITLDMTLPKFFKEHYRWEWFDYIHNSKTKKHE